MALNLEDFSVELLVRIQLFLSPRDIVAFRTTCNNFFRASQERMVWINALQDLCYDYHVYFPSFPVDRMSIAELQHSVASPYKLIKRLWTELDDEIPMAPTFVRLLVPLHGSFESIQNQSPPRYDDTLSFWGLDIIPGGRFIITNRSDGLIQLWDLGCPSEMLSRQPREMSSMIVENVLSDWAPSCYNELGSVIVVKVLCWSSITIDDEHGNTLNVYTIDPTSSNPTFLHIAQLTYKAIDFFCQITPLHLFIEFYDHTFCVWNFAEDAWATWILFENRDSNPFLTDVYVASGNMVLVAGTDILIYEFPALKARSAHEEVTELSIKPLICVHTSASRDCLTRHEFYLLPGQDARFAAFSHGQDTSTISMYSLKAITAVERNAKIPAVLPAIEYSYEVVCDRIANTSDGYGMKNLVDDTHMVSWTRRAANSDRKRCFVNLSRKDITGVKSRTGIWYLGSFESHFTCPMTGRVCMIQDGEVRVLDFVSPPSNIQQIWV